MPQIPGEADPSAVKLARAKYLAIQRAKRRLQNRLADLEWEYDELKPGLLALEQRITIVGELPPTITMEEEDPGGDSPDQVGS